MAVVTIELEAGESLTLSVACDVESFYIEDDPEPDEQPETVEPQKIRAVGGK